MRLNASLRGPETPFAADPLRALLATPVAFDRSLGPIDAETHRRDLLERWRREPTSVETKAIAREWVRLAMREGTMLALHYRALPEADVEADIKRLLDAFSFDKYATAEENAWRGYNLTLLLRYFARRYALDGMTHVRRVQMRFRALKMEGIESRDARWSLRAWRRRLADRLHTVRVALFYFCFPRIGLAVFGGFVVLGSSPELLDALRRASSPDRRFGLWLSLTILAVYYLAYAAVQRQVRRGLRGRRALRAILVTGVGGIWSATVGCVAFWIAPLLNAAEWTHSRQQAVLIGAGALLLGVALQLFWHDRSMGEPF